MFLTTKLIGVDQATVGESLTEDRFEAVIEAMERAVTPNWVGVTPGGTYTDVRGWFEYFNQGSDLGTADSGDLTEFCFKFWIPRSEHLCFKTRPYYMLNAIAAMSKILPSLSDVRKDLVIFELKATWSSPIEFTLPAMYTI